jgi:nitrite reductase (NADH) large subunit
MNGNVVRRFSSENIIYSYTLNIYSNYADGRYIFMNYLIIGNGVAGTEAALEIRKHDDTGTITLISESQHQFYYRPGLIEYLAGNVTIDKLTLYKDDLYRSRNIRTILDTRIVRILPDEKKAIDFNGSELPYDKLLLATGARPSTPLISGMSLQGIFTLRGITDADDIIHYCKNASSIVIIGGGLLGLETAGSMCREGRTVTVVEYFEWLLPRQLDPAGGAILMEKLEEKGLRFILHDSAASFEGDSHVEKVVLKSGKEIKADAVIISAGIKGRSELAYDAGIDINKGIVVNDYLETSIKDIYAAGDPVEHQGCMYGIWPAAREQGKIAGMNMAGKATPYSKTMMSNVLKITGIDLYSAGDFNATEAEVFSCAVNGTYKKFVMKDTPVAAIVLGDAEAVKIAHRVMDGKTDPDEFKDIIK